MELGELLSSIKQSIEKLETLGEKPTKVILNSKYKDVGKKYMVNEPENVFGIPLEFEDLGRLNFMFECEGQVW